MTDDFCLFEQAYSFTDDFIKIRLLLDDHGLMLESETGHMGAKNRIPLVSDPKWTFRYNLHNKATASSLITDLIDNLTEVKTWLDNNPGKPFAEFELIRKLME